eukprot:CAMPEP_0183720426 /NCGR_PEP_ID=MMETSP0737-20130205/13037_1 /TAXON_ID=385413 /ORGANISM="Thalassiosira miniscula, Strain CCMP1093" /LENGTH=384 /DNA_ID=CAMNT_0025950285 /DNA_START=58 /DNA_END=1212 /DNA_ORIENTATION=+
MVKPLRRKQYGILLAVIISALAASVATAASDVTFQQVFDAIDSNHDHSISESEYSSAVHKLAGVDNDGSTASAIGGSGVAVPPLGLDSPSRANAAKTGGGASGASKFVHDKLKFHNPDSTASFLKALFASFSAIMATEIGDKTFFIAAILSMRNDRMAVFGGAILALIVMTILSTFMGLVLPALIPRKYTHIIGGILFLYFGVKLLVDSRGMEDKVSEELEEVEEELAEMNKKKGKAHKKKEASGDGSNDVETATVENGDDTGAKKRRGGGGGGKQLKHAPSSSGLSAAGDYAGASWEAVFLQALTMTFLAEWGDRSQIATIALAAAKDPIGVTIGGCMGHSICTGMAVVGGRMLASRISEKAVAFYGGLVFLAFGVHSAFFEE